MHARLAALIVNYESGAFALALARQLQQQWRELGGAPDGLDLVVVDNASPADPSQDLAALERLGARVVRSATNLGYGAGMNLALAQTRGDPDDLVLVLNPDLALFPGALARLLDSQAALAGVGALGPRAFLDPARTWRMPPNRLPTPEGERLAARAASEAQLCAQLSEQRTRHALREWSAEAALEVEMLSGACLLLSRAAIAAAGGLFDERYPFYFEDTDLCRRLTRAGLRLVLEPRAEIVHHWARSSGIERGDTEPARRHAISRRAYFERWFDAEQRRALEPIAAPAAGHAPPATDRFQKLGALSRAPSLDLPGAGPWWVEVAMVPEFPLAAGAFVERAPWCMDERAFEWFYRGRYFLRALNAGDGQLVGEWCFDKPLPARSAPLGPGELSGSPS